MNLNRSHKIVLVALLVARSFLASAQTTNVVPPADYPKFIAQRNIFDPTRVANVPWSPRPRQVYTPQPVVNQVDSFSLVGIIGYDEGRMAGVYVFFDGTSPDYHKTAQLNDNIANFKIVDISADSVTLMSDTNNTTVLRIGEQLHNDGVGHWLSANGTAARYTNGRFGRNGFGGGGRRRNNFGNGNNRNYNNGNYNGGNNGNYSYGYGNFNRRGNNYAASPATSDNSQVDDQNLNSQNDNNSPDNNATPGNNIAPDNNMPPPPDDNAAPN